MLQMLISTMHLADASALVCSMNLQSDALIIDQCDRNGEEQIDCHGYRVRIVHTTERGLSRSRNMALRMATAQIVVFADDDFRYEDGYAARIEAAYAAHPSADLIVFDAIRVDGHVYRPIPSGRIRRSYPASVNSVRLTARRENLLEHGVLFDERFGAGAEVNFGEDTIFFRDCLRRGLHVYSEPVLLCRGMDTGRTSTWWSGYNASYFLNRGRILRRISRFPYPRMLYWLFKHRHKYRHRD